MSKILDSKNFHFKTIEGHDVLIHCEVYSYTYGWGHRACIVYCSDDFVNFNIQFFTGYDSAYEIILNLFGEFLDEYSYIQLCDLIDGGSTNESRKNKNNNL